MLDMGVRIIQDGAITTVEPHWWKRVSQEEFAEFIDRRAVVASHPVAESRHLNKVHQRAIYEARFGGRVILRELSRLEKWPGRQPEEVSDRLRIIAVPKAGSIVICSKGFAVASVHVKGMLGMVEVGEVELNAARSAPLDFDEEAFRDRLLSQLRPKIVDGLNSLVAEGTIPSRFSFLDDVAGAYGFDVLMDTSLPWIPVLERPGNAILLSPSQFMDIVSGKREVLIAYHTGPWSAEAVARARHPSASQDALIIPIPSPSGPPVGSYKEDNKLIRADLPEHFISDYSNVSRVGEARLLLIVLKLLGRVWNSSEERIFAADWVRGNHSLAGYLMAG